MHPLPMGLCVCVSVNHGSDHEISIYFMGNFCLKIWCPCSVNLLFLQILSLASLVQPYLRAAVIPSQSVSSTYIYVQCLIDVTMLYIVVTSVATNQPLLPFGDQC